MGNKLIVLFGLVILGMIFFSFNVSAANFCAHAQYYESRCNEYSNYQEAVEWCTSNWGGCDIYTNCDCTGVREGYDGSNVEIKECRYDYYSTGGNRNYIWLTEKGRYKESVAGDYDWCGFSADSCVITELRDWYPPEGFRYGDYYDNIAEGDKIVEGCGILTQEQCNSGEFFTRFSYLGPYEKCSIWNTGSSLGYAYQYPLKEAFCAPEKYSVVLDAEEYSGYSSRSYETPLENDLYKSAGLNVKSSISVSANLYDSSKADLTCKIDVITDCFYDLARFTSRAVIYKGDSLSREVVATKNVFEDSNVFYPNSSTISIQAVVDADAGTDYFCGLEIDSPIKFNSYSTSISSSVFGGNRIYLGSGFGGAFGGDFANYRGNLKVSSEIDLNDNERIFYSDRGYTYYSLEGGEWACSFGKSYWGDWNTPILDFNIYVQNDEGEKVVDLGINSCTRDGLCVVKGNDASVIFENIYSNRNGVRCVAESPEGFTSLSPLTYLTRGNVRNPEIYGFKDLNSDGIYNEDEKNKTVFLAFDDDWREALQVGAASAWSKGYTHGIFKNICLKEELGDSEKKWCDEMRKYFEWCDEISDGRCAVPFIPIHAEGNKIYTGAISNSLISQEPLDNRGPISLNEYLIQTKPDRVLCVDYEDVGRCNSVLNELPSGVEKRTISGKWWKQIWKDYPIVVVSDYDNYKTGLLAAQIASMEGAPIFFVGVENEGIIESDIFGKLLIVVGDIQCQSCLEKLKERNKILSYNVEDDILVVSDENIDRSLSFEQAAEFIKKRQGYFNGGTVVVNPNDIKLEYCESLYDGQNTFYEMYCKMSLLAPYISFINDAKIEFVETANPAPGVSDMIDAKDSYWNFITSLDLFNFNPALVGVQEAILILLDDSNSEVIDEVATQIRSFAVSGERVLLLGEQKAIPHGFEESLIVNGQPAISTGDVLYCDINQDGYCVTEQSPSNFNPVDIIISRLSKRSVTNGAIAANYKVFNEGNVCYYDDTLCPVNEYEPTDYSEEVNTA